MRTRLISALLFLGAILSGCDDKPPTYDAACSVPPSGWRLPKNVTGHMPVVLVRLRSDGEVFLENHPIRLANYEGVQVDDAELSRSLTATLDDDPPTHVVLDVASAAACKQVEHVRRLMQQSGVCPERCSEGRDWPFW